MIWESSYWKDPLLESAKRLKAFVSQPHFNETELVQIEKDIFIGFYSVRKLMDTEKIKDSTRDGKYQLEWYPNKEQVNLCNGHRMDKLYNFAQVFQETRSLKFICDQFVHSFIFTIEHNAEGGLSGFYFCSDKEKNKRIYYLPLETVIEIYELVGNDYPSSSKSTFNPDTGEIVRSVW